MSKVLLCGDGGKDLSSLLDAWDHVKKINAMMPVTASENRIPGDLNGAHVLSK